MTTGSIVAMLVLSAVGLIAIAWRVDILLTRWRDRPARGGCAFERSVRGRYGRMRDE